MAFAKPPGSTGDVMRIVLSADSRRAPLPWLATASAGIAIALCSGSTGAQQLSPPAPGAARHPAAAVTTESDGCAGVSVERIAARTNGVTLWDEIAPQTPMPAPAPAPVPLDQAAADAAPAPEPLKACAGR
jgi:hypothetical protein